MRNFSHIIRIGVLTTAFLISVRGYYTTYKFHASLDQPKISDNFTKSLKPLRTFLNHHWHDRKNLKQYYHLAQLSKRDPLLFSLHKLNITQEDIESLHRSRQNYSNFMEEEDPQKALIAYNNCEIISRRTEKDLFKSENKKLKPGKNLRRFEGRINSNFYNAALNIGVPASIVKEAVTALSYTINFQLGIKKGDPFEILYEEYRDDQGNLIKAGNLRYVSVLAKGQLHSIYSYAPAGAKLGYYNARGESVARGLLQTPIDSRRMRITSKFGSRIHPIKGYRKDHKGVDFGAPYGTNVIAAGDGIVVRAGYFGDYGNYIRIRHANGYETVYAHLSKIAPSIRRGAFVKQRQWIGNVGATGSATGPHLHHEVIYKNVHINPQSIKALAPIQLASHEIKQFNKFKQQVEAQIISLSHIVRRF